jgi:hypothetical protein
MTGHHWHWLLRAHGAWQCDRCAAYKCYELAQRHVRFTPNSGRESEIPQ